MATKYVMVEVYDREIVVYQYENLEDAKADLRESFEEVSDGMAEDCCYISDDGMVAYVHDVEPIDWQIEAIN